MTLHTILVSAELRNIPELPIHVFSDHPDWRQSKMYQKSKSLESAKNNAIPYEDQENVAVLIIEQGTGPLKEGQIYSFDYLGRIEVVDCCVHDSCPVDAGCEHCKEPVKVIRLIPESKEESQEELWGKAIELLYDACHKNMMADVDEMKTGDDFVKWRASLMSSHFTITRKPLNHGS
jgi:hypothetical protein